jgi:hypothetical protein
MENLSGRLRLAILLIFAISSIGAMKPDTDVGLPFTGWLLMNGGYAQVPYQTEISMAPESGSFTIEGWIKNPSFGAGSNSGRDVIYKKSSFSLNFSNKYNASPFPGTNTYSVTFLTCGSLCSGTIHKLSSCASNISCIPQGWFHFAYVFNQTTNEGAFFLNGTLLGSASSNSSTEPIVLQYANSMDEIRISNNVRYTASFTPALAPFECDANTEALWHFNEIAGATNFHDVCGTVDNTVNGYNGAHAEGVPGYMVFLPVVTH